MPNYKNIRVKKKGGGTRMQRVQVLASGQYKFVKNTGKKAVSKARKSYSKARKTRRTARRTYSRPKGGRTMGKRNQKIPLGITIGSFLTLKGLYDNWNSAPADLKVPQLILDTTGIIDSRYTTRLGYVEGQKFDYMRPLMTYAPAGVGYGISTYMGGSKNGVGLNLNRKLSGIPLFKI